MNCPACNNELQTVEITGVKVQACVGSCGGLWFEWSAIKKLRDRIPAAGAELLHVERAEGVHTFRDIQHPCPHCILSLLYRHCFNREFRYEIDQCAKCAGFWVDVGSLSDLPLNAPTEEDRQKAAAYFKILFEENLNPENLPHPDTHEAVQTIHQIFRFLTPAILFPEKTPLDPSK
jgi:Zn-finger nucleic acid-binding protein